MDVYQFILQNGKDFWSISPNPGGSDSKDLLGKPRTRECCGGPAPQFHPEKEIIPERHIDWNLVSKINKLLVRRNELDEEIKSLYLGNEDKLPLSWIKGDLP